MDDEAGGYLAARHLLDTCRRRLAFVGGPTSIPQPTEALGRTTTELLAEEVEFRTRRTVRWSSRRNWWCGRVQKPTNYLPAAIPWTLSGR
ncbi:Transcriptional regulator of rhamnose utilization, LacI family [Arthrobacter sp. DR-2P]|nr:Transcriptional regulator of rhamnose utilization, LacI family [Arthrobacter sp. DR-2P]